MTTHDTEAHTGGHTDDKTQANMGLVENESVWGFDDAFAWHLGIHNTFCLQDI